MRSCVGDPTIVLPLKCNQTYRTNYSAYPFAYNQPLATVPNYVSNSADHSSYSVVGYSDIQCHLCINFCGLAWTAEICQHHPRSGITFLCTKTSFEVLKDDETVFRLWAAIFLDR